MNNKYMSVIGTFDSELDYRIARTKHIIDTREAYISESKKNNGSYTKGYEEETEQLKAWYRDLRATKSYVDHKIDAVSSNVDEEIDTVNSRLSSWLVVAGVLLVAVLMIALSSCTKETSYESPRVEITKIFIDGSLDTTYSRPVSEAKERTVVSVYNGQYLHTTVKEYDCK